MRTTRKLRKVKNYRPPKLGEFTNHTHPFVKFMWEDIIRRELMLKSVAEVAGVDPSTLHKWRNNPKGPYLYHIEHVLETLGYRLEIVKIKKKQLEC